MGEGYGRPTPVRSFLRGWRGLSGMALADTIWTLSRTPLFRLLDAEALRLIAFSAETRKLRPGEVLFSVGERSDGGYVVLEGEVEIRPAAGESFRAGSGALIGRNALFVRLQRPSTTVATDEALLLRVSPTLMRRILEEFPDGAQAIRDEIASDLSDLTDSLDQVRDMLLAVDKSR